jgi:hypothetical protein
VTCEPGRSPTRAMECRPNLAAARRAAIALCRRIDGAGAPRSLNQYDVAGHPRRHARRASQRHEAQAAVDRGRRHELELPQPRSATRRSPAPTGVPAIIHCAGNWWSNVAKRPGFRRRDDDLRRSTNLGSVLSGQRIGFLDLWAACERSTDRGRRNRRPIGSPPVVSFADQHPSEIECEGNKRDCADDVESPHYLLLASCSTISRPR